MNKFRDLRHKIFYIPIKEIFIYFINLITLSYYFIVCILKKFKFLCENQS